MTFVGSSVRDERLDAGDLERVGRFVTETAAIEGDEPFPPAFLAALRRLVPCDSVTFCELDRIAERELGATTVPEEPGSGEAALDYWQARHGHPICHYHETTGDWRAYRLSDFVQVRRFRAGRIYAEWFRPLGVENLITVGLDAPLSHTRVFLLARSGGRDFDASDCLLSTSCDRTSRCATTRLAVAARSRGARVVRRADAQGARGPGARRRGHDQRGDRRAAPDLVRHGAPPPREHLPEAGRPHEDSRRPRRCDGRLNPSCARFLGLLADSKGWPCQREDLI